MKKEVITIPLLLGLGLVSAAYYGSFYSGNFSFRDLLYSLDPLILVFLAVLILTTFAFGKFFKHPDGSSNRAMAGVMGIIIALFITWGMNRTGFDFDNLLYNIGFSEGSLVTIIAIAVPLIVLAIALFKGLGVALITLGLVLLVTAFFSYEAIVAVIIGWVCIILGAYFWYKKKKKEKYKFRY